MWEPGEPSKLQEHVDKIMGHPRTVKAEPKQKPQWAQVRERAGALFDEAEQLVAESKALRCPVHDSVNTRCSADKDPDHVHRYEAGDFPVYRQAESVLPDVFGKTRENT
jgi:hypothetical protein